MSWIIRKQTGEAVYAAVLDGKRVGWGSEKAAERRRAELELYYLWPFDAVVEEIEDEAVADAPEGAQRAQEPVIEPEEAEGGR